METPKEYYYTYYSYEEWGRGYIGSRLCCCLPEEDVKYFGSFKDKTFKPTHKIILKSGYSTREEAYADEIILQHYYKVVENPHFVNKAYQTSTKFYVPRKQAIEYAKKGGLKNKENLTGFCGRTKEKMREDGKRNYEMGIGIHALTKEEKGAAGKKGGLKNKENGTGICGISLEQRSKTTTKTNLQRWICTETGFVTNAGNLSRYQRARGIDTSKRKRIS